MRYLKADGRYEYAVKDFPKTQAGWRVVAIPQAFQWIHGALYDMTGAYEYVFTRKGSRMITNCFRRRTKRVCEHVGIPPRSPHKIRKTYCSILFDSGNDQKLITDQIGYTDIMCSELHYHRNRKDLNQKIETISSAPEFKQRLKLISM